MCAAAHCTALCCHALCVLRPALHCVYCAAKRTVCAVHCPALHCAALGGKNIALRGGGGGVTRRPVFATPPPPSLAAVTGGGRSGRGRPTCRAGGGGGVNPTSMAQNDTHIALIILTTQMWGGELLVEKTFSGQICVPVPLAPTSVLTQNKGPDTEPHFSNPPPLPSAGVHVNPPPRAPQSNFQVAQGTGCVHTPKAIQPRTNGNFETLGGP